jgi:small GTP-binding protein
VAWSPDGRLALSGSDDNTVRVWEVESGRSLRVLEGHSARVLSVAWSPDGRLALSGSADKTVRVWEVESGRSLRVLEGHSYSVLSVAWSPDGRLALSSSDDKTVRMWEVESGSSLRVLESYSARVLSMVWSPDGRLALFGSGDSTLRVRQVESGHSLGVLKGHSAGILSVAWSPDGRLALSGSWDKTVRVWEVKSGRLLRVLEGHSDSVWSVAWSPDGRLALSGSSDKTVRVWELESGRLLRVLEGHSAGVVSVAWSPDGRLALSASIIGVVRVWRLPVDVRSQDAGMDDSPSQVQYANAKVLLVGESGAGKTGLSMRLALNRWTPSDSTVGAWATHWKLPLSGAGSVEREIWLWDFGGQADQRLIHQLYMEDTALAVLVFDGQRENLFDSLGQWDRDLHRASKAPFTKLLVAGRVDTGGLRVSRMELEKFASERGFGSRIIETSAKANTGCEELKHAILSGIDWDHLPWRSSPEIFKRLKEEIVRLKDGGCRLMRFNELRDGLRLRLAARNVPFGDEELRTVVGLLAGPGVVWQLEFGDFVLLQPELINTYAQAVIQTLKEDEFERGCLAEERVLRGDLTYPPQAPRLPTSEERFILLAMHQTLVERGLCLREHTSHGPILIFPSYYRRERPDLEGHPAVLVSYHFEGFLDDIYATLVVRLHHTEPFQSEQLWRYAADFKTQTGKQLGIKQTRLGEGAGEIEVYFDPAIPVEEKIIFARYVHDHLLQKARNLKRLRHYVCPHCGTPVENRKVAMERLEQWLSGRQTSKPGSRAGRKPEPTILCVGCEKRVPLWDQMEELFASDETRERVRDLEAQSQRGLDNESKERALVGEVISTVALAGQISREFNVSDHGIDMEIEFKSDAGEATGRKLYLQLKSGDSWLRQRKRDGAEIFTIKDERHVRYWADQAFPVLLVIRDSKGEIRWMEIQKPGRSTVFQGERFDVMSVRRWRDRVLGHRRT